MGCVTLMLLWKIIILLHRIAFEHFWTKPTKTSTPKVWSDNLLNRSSVLLCVTAVNTECQLRSYPNLSKLKPYISTQACPFGFSVHYSIGNIQCKCLTFFATLLETSWFFPGLVSPVVLTWYCKNLPTLTLMLVNITRLDIVNI